MLTEQSLKLIAIVSMTIDHIGAALFPQELWMRCIGRLAFVLYAFMIAEGYVHTKNVRRYMLRLGLLALISEVPFDLLFHGCLVYTGAQNVFFTLFLGLLALAMMDRVSVRLPAEAKLLALLPVAAAGAAALWLHCDYRLSGVLMIAVFYVCRSRPIVRTLAISVILTAMNRIQMFGIAALALIGLYNGKRGRGGAALKWLFYAYYPLHMLAICSVREWV